VRIGGKKVLLTGALRLAWTRPGFAIGRGRRKAVSSRPAGSCKRRDFRCRSDEDGEAATFVGQDLGDLALIINGPFMEFSIAKYQEQMRVNASAGFAFAQAVGPGMINKNYGKIVNFCSVTLNGLIEGCVPYVASKGALYGLTKTLARELGGMENASMRRAPAPCAGKRKIACSGIGFGTTTTGCSIGSRSKNACNPSMWPTWCCFFAPARPT
jgi:hypothetical protein